VVDEMVKTGKHGGIGVEGREIYEERRAELMIS
jgi:hypothetical protein